MSIPQTANSFNGEERLLIEPIVAYKGWTHYVTDDGDYLCSTVLQHQWIPGRIELARCPHEDATWFPQIRNHEIPSPACSCGFYALKDAADLVSHYLFPFLGRVELSGRVVIGTLGYRAEKAKITGIFDTPFATLRPAKMAERYGVPLLDPPERSKRSGNVFTLPSPTYTGYIASTPITSGSITVRNNTFTITNTTNQ